MDRTTRQKISKEIEDLNNTISQLDLTVMYRTFHLTIPEYIFSSRPHGTVFKIDYRLGHK